MATIEDDDERLLAEIGYEQVRIHLLRISRGTESPDDHDSLSLVTLPSTQPYLMPSRFWGSWARCQQRMVVL
jgi:hypothetical protein